MEYITSLSSQAKNFLFSLGFGVLIGVLYDLLRIVRMSVSSSKRALYITDFIFAPFRKIFSRVSVFIKKAALKTRKSTKKSIKNAKILLQNDKSLLYNLNNNIHKLCHKPKRTEVKKKYESEENEKSS